MVRFSTENPVTNVEIDEPEDRVDDPGVSEYPDVSVAVLAVLEEVEVHEEEVKRCGADEEHRGGGVDVESVPVNEKWWVISEWLSPSSYLQQRWFEIYFEYLALDRFLNNALRLLGDGLKS